MLQIPSHYYNYYDLYPLPTVPTGTAIPNCVGWFALKQVSSAEDLQAEFHKINMFSVGLGCCQPVAFLANENIEDNHKKNNFFFSNVYFHIHFAGLQREERLH